MDLFKLLGTIAVDNSEANKALSETGEMGSKAESKLGKAFAAVGKGAVAVGKTVAAGMAAAGTAVVGLVTKSIQSYADYEQLVGGVETLFKDSADKVMEYANNAYKTAGLSANEYMETVTSFSASLLQSLGGDTAKAAEKADMAITDMSDNANKMGTSMEMIQNAYNGFAKANYTMLDNLKLGYGGTGEEMKRLLKDAEAISGIKYDISSYGDIVDAIHVIQTEMGITGTTAKEAASTISGSIGMMKASWQNLITAMSDENADFGGYVNNFVDSVTAVADNLMPRIEIALNGVAQLIEKLAPVILGRIPELLSTLLPSVVNAALGIVNAFVEIIPGVASALGELLPVVMEGILNAFSGITAAIPNILQTVIDVVHQVSRTLMNTLPELLPLILESLLDIGSVILNNLPTLLQTVTSVIYGIVDALPALLGMLGDRLPELMNDLLFGVLPELISILADQSYELISMLINYIMDSLPYFINAVVYIVEALGEQLPVLVPALIQAVIDIVERLVEYLPELIPILVNSVSMIFTAIMEQIPVLLPMLVNAVIQLVTALVSQLPVILPTLIQALSQLLNLVLGQLPVLIPVLVQALVQIVMLLVEQIPIILPMLIQAVIDICMTIMNALITNLPTIMQALIAALPVILQAVWDAIVMIFKNLPQWFGQLFEGAVDLIQGAFHSVVAFFQGIWDGIAESFGYVGQYFGNIFSAGWDAIKLVFDVAVDYFKMVWNNIKLVFSVVKNVLSGNFSEAWESIKKIFSNVGSFFTGVWDKIKNAFSSIGTKIGNAISGAVKGAINGVISLVENRINGFLKMINGAIGLINKIPGVNISKVKLVEFQRLAKGGVVDEPTPAVFGEDGAEAVVPLENNNGWMRKVAKNIHSFMYDATNQPGNPGVYGYTARSTDQAVTAMIRADVEAMKNTLDGILDVLDVYMPSIRERMEHPIPAVVGVDQAADALVDPINYRLGRIAVMKGRGR